MKLGNVGFHFRQVFRSKTVYSHVGRLCNVGIRWGLAMYQQPDQHGEEIRSVRKELSSWLDTEEVMW